MKANQHVSGGWQLAPQIRELVKQSLLGLLSDEASLAQPRVWGLLRDVCENCDLGMTTLVRLAGEGRSAVTARFAA